ncbi:MAG: glycosyltransferase family 4 protein [Candidatus Lokiarchaeota archaeon]|nr:glycosyltransferase family 4 protein [Candidatus Lokiarchaeota archaeon]
MKIINYIGRKLPYINGILRRQIELDRCISKQKKIDISYFYYLPPRNPFDFLIKRFIKYPIQSYKNNKEKDTINHISAQIHSDILHFLNKSKTIITCHDIHTFMEKKNLQNPILLQKYMLSGLRKCRHIIAISEFTKNEMIKALNIPEERIVVINNGINNDIFYPIKEYEKINISPLFPNHKKILHVGTEVARKNIPTLLRAFYYVKKEIKNVKLIRIGRPKYQSMVRDLKLENDIVYISDINNPRLREIYNLADILVFPSFYEGWGFPGLEAASCGLPVICSDIPTFKEIYKDFPLFYPPKDFKKLSKLIINTINNDDRKKSMTKKGLKIAKSYTWEKSAREYLKLISSII